MVEPAAVPIYVRQLMADGKTRVIEFRARELSRHHLLLAADDLGLLEVGEEVELMIGAPGERWSGGRARVVGSERVFGQPTRVTANGVRLTASGYRLAWVAPDEPVSAAIEAVGARASG